MNNTTFINFSAFDYNNTDSLSTYCIEIAPLLFIPDIPQGFPHRLVWDFGDSTTSKNVSASKTYKFPGIYNVSLVVYDCDTNAMISTYTKEIKVYNFTPFTFNVRVDSVHYLLTEDGDYVLNDLGDYILVDLPSMEIKNAQFSEGLMINSFYPSYQTPSSIFYTIQGSNSIDYWAIKDNKFSHLERTRSLYEKVYNYHTQDYQFKAIDKVEFSPVELYAKISGNSIVYCKKTDTGAIFVGLSGSKEVFIKDDTVVEDAKIKFKFDKTKNFIPTRNDFVGVRYLNNLGIDVNYNIIENDEIDRLSITSNGMDGEFYSISSFDIHNTKYYETKIPFVVKIKDIENTSPKNFDSIQLSSLDISISGRTVEALLTEEGEPILDEQGSPMYTWFPLTLSAQNYDIYSLSHTLSSQSSGGAFRGYVVFHQLSSQLDSAVINIAGSFVCDHSVVYELSGASTLFNVYPHNFYDIWKVNENFNPRQTLEDLRFQETLLDKTVLFQDFLGGILGDTDSDHEAVGIKSYEKIANFTKNTQDVDTCEIDFLESCGQFVGYNQKGEEFYNYPEKIRRLVNLGSVDKSKLTGTTNKFKENLDIRGRASKTEYGINIGNKLDPNTYIVNIDVPIVALEKFSNTYIVINTYSPLILETVYVTDEFGNVLVDEFDNIVTTSIEHTVNYPLSAYNQDWGWPLVLPNDFTFNDIEKYYLFFDYNSQYDNTILDGLIDFENPKTNIPIEDINLDVFEHMAMDTMYQILLPV